MSGKVTTMFDIRELLRHLREGRSARAIHRALGLGRPTIAKYRRWAEQEGLLSGPLPSLAEVQARLQVSLPPAPPQTVSSVEPHRAVVLDLLARGLEIEALYQRLRENHGFTGKYSAVWRFVRKLEPQRAEATVRVEVPPGTEAQVDFGDAGRMFDPVQQKLRRAWAFVMTLSWSRHQYVEFVFDQRVPTWLSLHRHALEFFGGVPQRIVLDRFASKPPSCRPAWMIRRSSAPTATAPSTMTSSSAPAARPRPNTRARSRAAACTTSSATS